MADIIERLRFDAARCEVDYSKGVATNIEAGIAEIERLRTENADLRRIVWLIARGSQGYTLERAEMEDYPDPGDDRPVLTKLTDATDGSVTFLAQTAKEAIRTGES